MVTPGRLLFPGLLLVLSLGPNADAGQEPAGTGSLRPVFIVPNFHPASCGWLTDFSTERNYCANDYLAHLDKVRDDPNYAFALSEVNNIIAMMNFAPQRIPELKQRIKEGRVELANAFLLEPTINLSGGEALVKSGIEGLRWQQGVLGTRPRLAWMIDVTGVHEQMGQIVAGLGLDAMVYHRDNPTTKTLHWLQSPDGSRALALCPGVYSDWGQVFNARKPLGQVDLRNLLIDARAKAQQTPGNLPVLVLGGHGDYSLPPALLEYPTEFLRQWQQMAPGVPLRFTGPSAYLDAILPEIRSGRVEQGAKVTVYFTY
jgi:alpha-mannosidase